MADGEPEAEKTQSPLGTLVEQSRAQGWVDQSWGSQHHDDVVAPEIEAINTRREEGRPLANPGSGKMLDVVGLALSGGGIRSSAVCLGVLQALNHHDLIKRIDYLSTVSGGGYIGASLSATMTIAKRFVFGATPVSATGQPLSSEISDTPEVGHIRNYSNYLIPAGMRDVLTGIAIVVRGLVANVGLTLPFVVLLAAITAASNPVRSCLYTANFFGFRVDDGSLIPSMLKRVPLIATLGFTYAGIVLALLLLLFREIGYRLSSPELRSRNVPVGYAAGIAVVIGVICDIARYLPVDNFGLTLAACMIGLLLFFIWALVRSFLRPENLQEFRGHLPTMGATFLVLLAAIAFLEFQPFIIGGMFDVADASSGQSFGLVTGIAIGWIKSLAAITAPIAAVVTLFRQQFGELLKGAASSQWTSQIMAYLAKGALWLAGTALPLLIWIGFIYLSYWAIANDKVLKDRTCEVDWPAPGDAAAPKAPASLTGKIQFDSGAKTLTAEIAGKPAAQPEAKSGPPKPPDPMEHSPGWLTSAAKYTFGEQGLGLSLRWSLVDVYLLFAAVLFVLSWQLKPNANSLHRLYRDRLSKAFLFAPVRQHRTMARNDPSLDQGRDYPELDDYHFELSWLYPSTQANPPTRKLEAPYHLINAALNIQGSDFANRRGRNADFFLFSPLRVGSEATGYEETQVFEDKEKGLDLATAIAISGAAASSNMGSNSIRALTPTLALLNIRLGYWLKNPRYIADDSQPVHRSTLYLWSEISGRLYENSDAVYLTDGGHIENLGVYELLRRRCKVIIAVDAEADAPMNFSSLMTLQRYARIDLGILIDLPWSPIRTCTLSVMDRNAGKPPPSPPPPEPDRVHVAIGTIDYGGGEKGYLVYIKSSLTGNENDYIRDYARRNDRFPHETTGDQFFSEEQFEVYRALGFNMAHGFLDDAPDAREVVVNTETERCVTRKFSDTGVAAIREVRAALGLAVPAADSTSEGEDTEA